MSISQFQYQQMLARTSLKQASATLGQSPDRESYLHDEILDYCRSKGWLAIHSRMDRKATQQLGVSDFIIIAPGHVWFIEAKRKGQKLRPEQAAFRAQILKLGFTHAVVHSMDEFLEAISPVSP